MGVDVFLVISGFLITGLLLREQETSGRIALLAFYARRIRRLLPAAVVVIATVMPLAFVALSPLDRPVAMTDGGAAVLCVSNIRSAMGAGDYFAAVATPSPFLHFWSLSLEEQFYLVWPVLLMVAVRCRRARLAAGITLLTLFVASLVASVVLTDVAPTWSFYVAALAQLAVRGGRPAGPRLDAPATAPRPARRDCRMGWHRRTRGRCGRNRRHCSISRPAGRPADRSRCSPDPGR